MNRYASLLFATVLLATAGVQAQPAPGAVGAAAPGDVLASAQLSDDVQVTPGDGRQGTVKTVRGEVTLVSGQTRRAAVAGGSVRQGDQIVTGAGSSTAVTLRDGTVVSVGPDSAVTLSQYRFEPVSEDGGIALSLVKGSLRLVTGLITRTASSHEPARVKVTTPTAVIGVRGTDVVVDANS
jgi:hypothetical protein